MIKIEDGNLCCPGCGEDYLHHYMVTVYDRKEDDPTTRVVTVGGPSIQHWCGPRMAINLVSHDVASERSGNPSSRRDGVAIRFECELCDAGPFELTFAQHKGVTQVKWRGVPKRALLSICVAWRNVSRVLSLVAGSAWRLLRLCC